MRATLREAFASHTAAEWEAFLRTQPEAIWERMRDWHEVLEDPQNLVNDYIATIDVPGFGATRTVGNVVGLSETPGSVKGGPPVLGEGNAELLGPLGFSRDELAEIERRATEVREAAFALLLGTAAPAPE